MQPHHRKLLRSIWPFLCSLFMGGLIGGITHSWSVGALGALAAGLYFHWNLSIPALGNGNGAAAGVPAQNALDEDELLSGGPYLFPRENSENPLESMAATQEQDVEMDLGFGWGAWPNK